MVVSPFDPDMVGTSDYLHTAQDLQKVVVGETGAWGARVRGFDPEDGAFIGVAWYGHDYLLKSDANRRAGQLLRHVRDLRLAAL